VILRRKKLVNRAFHVPTSIPIISTYLSKGRAMIFCYWAIPSSLPVTQDYSVLTKSSNLMSTPNTPTIVLSLSEMGAETVMQSAPVIFEV
jgi:hypothetical protein